MAHVAQLVEHVLGKDEVTRSIRVVGSIPAVMLMAMSVHGVSAALADHIIFSYYAEGVRYGEGEI